MKTKMWEVAGIEQYRQSVRRDHKTRVVRAGFSLYAWFWFHTEFWLSPEARRPYTFMMRDWIYPHVKIFAAIIISWYVGMFFWLHWSPYPPSVLLTLSSWLAAHLIWGGTWVKDEQEWPPYMGETGAYYYHGHRHTERKGD